MDEKFEKLIYKNCDNNSFESIIALVILFGISVILLYWGITTRFTSGIVLGIIASIFSFYTYRKHKGEFKGGAFWAGVIRENPNSIVWIKPIITNHTVGLVVTLYKERKFQFLTKDGQRTNMKCDSDLDQQVFFEGVKKYLSFAHVGYSLEIDELYNVDPEKFIVSLKRKGLYTPINTFGY